MSLYDIYRLFVCVWRYEREIQNLVGGSLHFTRRHLNERSLDRIINFLEALGSLSIIVSFLGQLLYIFYIYEDKVIEPVSKYNSMVDTKKHLHKKLELIIEEIFCNRLILNIKWKWKSTLSYVSCRKYETIQCAIWFDAPVDVSTLFHILFGDCAKNPFNIDNNQLEICSSVHFSLSFASRSANIDKIFKFHPLLSNNTFPFRIQYTWDLSRRSFRLCLFLSLELFVYLNSR